MLVAAGRSVRWRPAQCGPSNVSTTRADGDDGPRTDPDRTDHRHRATGRDAVVTGPSLASASPAAGRGRGPAIRRAAIGLALVLTFSVGIGVGRLDLPALGGFGTTTPAPNGSSATNFGLISEAWDILHSKYVGADAARRPRPDLRRDQRHDRGRRRHRPHLVPDPRGARPDAERPVRLVRRDRRPDRHRRRTACRSSSASSTAARPRRPGSSPATRSSRSTARPTTGHTIDEVVGWVRGEAGTTVDRHRPERRRRARAGARRSSAPTCRDQPVSWAIVPGTKTALLRLDQFSNGAADDLKARPRRRQGGRRRPASSSTCAAIRAATSTRPWRSPASSSRAATSTSSGRADGHETTPRGLAGRARHGPAARRPGRRRHRQLVRDRVRRASRTPAAARSSASRRTGPGRSSASSRCRTGRRCGSGPSSG